MKIKLRSTEMSPSVMLAVLAAALASGCASTDTTRLVAKTVTTANITVTIKFDADSCPTEVVPPPQGGCIVDPQGFCIGQGRSVKWVSDPSGTPFELYFDPFVGRPYKSRGPDETTPPILLQRGAMPGIYKYSVLGLACTDDSKAILDPPIRVE